MYHSAATYWGPSCSQQNLRSIPTRKLSKGKYERSRKAKNFPQILQNISYPAPIPSSSAEWKTKLLQESLEIFGMCTTLPPSFWAKPSSAHRTAALGKVHSSLMNSNIKVPTISQKSQGSNTFSTHPCPRHSPFPSPLTAGGGRSPQNWGTPAGDQGGPVLPFHRICKMSPDTAVTCPRSHSELAT